MNTQRARHIRIVSGIFRVLTLLGFILLALAALIFLVVNFDATVGMGHWQIKDLKPEFAWLKRPLVLFVLIFPTVALWRLYQLFGLTAKGGYFTAEAVRHIRFLGFWMIVYGVASFGLQFVQLLSTAPQNELRFGLDGYFFGGLLVLLLAWIMDEGRQLQDEQHLTV